MKLPVVGKAHEAEGASGPFVWFVYGSSLHRPSFEAWATEHGYRVPDLSSGVPARLEGHRLAFDVISRFWGGAVGTPTPSPGDAIEGLAVTMPPEARGLVDHKEGAISGLFEPFAVEVTPLGGGAPLRAVAYRAVASGRAPREIAPAPRWLEVVIEGARAAGLTDDWIRRLERLASP